MKEYGIIYARAEDDAFIILPSRLKVWWWLIRNLHRCHNVMITVFEGENKNGSHKDD